MVNFFYEISDEGGRYAGGGSTYQYPRAVDLACGEVRIRVSDAGGYVVVETEPGTVMDGSPGGFKLREGEQGTLELQKTPGHTITIHATE